MRTVPYLMCVFAAASQATADDPLRPSPTFDGVVPHQNPPDLSVVPQSLWDDIDHTIDLSLRYLAAQQHADGSVNTIETAKPAITSLAVMSMLSAGHQPGVGPYGSAINKGIDYVLSIQMKDGLFSSVEPTGMTTDFTNASHLGTYNHAICGLMLGEVYGMTDPDRAARIRPAMEKALAWLREIQLRPIPIQFKDDRGGWRYVHLKAGDQKYSDTSVTSWQIMFLRSAHNAGFEVPQNWVDEALDYMERCFEPRSGGFVYSLIERRASRGTTGAGIVSLFFGGRYDAEIESLAGEWLMRQEFTRYNRSRISGDRYFYGAYYCSQAAFQLGGDYWAQTYPSMARTMCDNQRPDGSFHRCHRNDVYGEQYSTGLAVLALTPPYQLLPIYQR